MFGIAGSGGQGPFAIQTLARIILCEFCNSNHTMLVISSFSFPMHVLLPYDGYMVSFRPPTVTWKWYLYQYVYSIHLDGCKG
jgi:hypothetical protein